MSEPHFMWKKTIKNTIPDDPDIVIILTDFNSKK